MDNLKRFNELSNEPVKTREHNISEYWKEIDLLHRSVEVRDPKKPYIFYEGPPTANGKPGIHHVMARTLKDLTCRYKTMKGFQVKRKAGWDTHGLPVEIEVEKQLNLKSGETTPDMKFTVGSLRCVGACGLAPVVTVNDKVYGHVTTDQVQKIISEYM